MRECQGGSEKRKTKEGRENRREEKKKRKDNSKRGNSKIRMIFWNIAGLKKKDREFWEYIEKFDMIGMCETWIEEKE